MSESKGCGEFVTPHERCEEGFLCVKCKNVGFILSYEDVETIIKVFNELEDISHVNYREQLVWNKLLEFVNK